MLSSFLYLFHEQGIFHASVHHGFTLVFSSLLKEEENVSL